MSHTAKLVEARDRINALSEKQRQAATHAVGTGEHHVKTLCSAKAAGLDLAVKVIEDILAE